MFSGSYLFWGAFILIWLGSGLVPVIPMYKGSIYIGRGGILVLFIMVPTQAWYVVMPHIALCLVLAYGVW